MMPLAPIASRLADEAIGANIRVFQPRSQDRAVSG